MPFTQTKTSLGGLSAGMVTDLTASDCTSFFNEEASAELAFGTMLVAGTATDSAKLATANTNNLIGILRNDYRYAYGVDFGSIGLKPKTSLPVLQRGKIMVVVAEAVTPASPVRIRVNTSAGANGATNGPGTFCTTSSAGNTMRLPFARFLGTTTGPGVVELEIDMTMRASAVND